MRLHAIELDSTRLLGFDQTAKPDRPARFLAAKVGDKQSDVAGMAGSGISHEMGSNLHAKIGVKTR